MSCIRSISPSEVYQYLSEHKLVGVAVAIGVAAFILGGLAYGNIGGSIGKCLSNLPYKWTLLAGGGLWLVLTWILSPQRTPVQKGDPVLAQKAQSKSTGEHSPVNIEDPSVVANKKAGEAFQQATDTYRPPSSCWVPSPGADTTMNVDVNALVLETAPGIAAMKNSALSGDTQTAAVDPDQVVFSTEGGGGPQQIPRWKYI